MPALYDNKYLFEKELGSGGFGKVFLAREKVSNRLVAIKQLHNKDPKEQDAIIREIQVVAKFNHSKIVTYHHHFYQDDLFFLVMEFCEKGSLRSRMEKQKPAPAEVLRWLLEIAEALHFIHKKGIVHHDIKPDNILFSDNDKIKISDFGIADTVGGTRAYMSPEALSWDSKNIFDVRVDIYALGVTMMELLTGNNPFYFQSKESILAIHNKGDFAIKNLPNWIQEIILKAINKVPELRFQSMADFAEAIKSRHVPLILNKDTIKAGELAEQAERFLDTKKWAKAGALLDFAANQFPNNVNVIKTLGKYHLAQQAISKAKGCYEKALQLNSRLDVQKELGWLNLADKNFPTAISLLSDHLHRNPSDYETYNLLLQCFYETNRYEAGMDLAKTILQVSPENPCFINNYYVCSVMLNLGKTVFSDTVMKVEKENVFFDYNISVVLENEPTHNLDKTPTLKSKLLFMDYRFLKMEESTLYFIQTSNTKGLEDRIIKFGREGLGMNEVQVSGGTSVSRRHCLILNFKKDVWLYDLNSTGTYVNGTRVENKVPLVGFNKIRIGKIEYLVTTDKNKLL